jgi:hypothetical protein
MSTSDNYATPTIYDVNIKTKNKVDGNAVITLGPASANRLWQVFTPTQNTNGGTIEWHYCLTNPCASWTSLGANGGSINQTGSYLYLRFDVNANRTNNATPSITGATITYKQ